MENLSGKNIMVAMPQNQFDEDELFIVRSMLISAGANVTVLSKSGREAVGNKKSRFDPDGIIVDWDKQPGISGKYHAVLVTGGKGSPKSLWDDPILPQILNDHYRAGRVIGAIGLSVVVLARGGFLSGETAAPDHEQCLQELELAGLDRSDQEVTCNGRVVTGRDGAAAEVFAKVLIETLAEP